MKTNSDYIEKIANVKLNYNYYSGEDLYSEGVSEDALLDAVKKHSEQEYEALIQHSRSWSFMYHLSYIRENIVSWLPLTGTEKVLEIGAGCGAITGKLCEMAESVTCIELSKKRSLINAYRHKEFENLEIIVGNFKDIEPDIEEKYDYITLIGVLEYAGSYIGGESPYIEMVKTMKKHLKEDGKIIIAIENKFGLKYFAGCKEDHTGTYYEGIEGYTEDKGVHTFSKDQLEEIVRTAGLCSKFYYPYPDYKLPHTIFSDEYLPKKGELTTNLRNYDSDRLVTFDEGKVFDSVIEDGKFPFFSNSFVVVASFDDVFKISPSFPVYTKYANERSALYRVGTSIDQSYDNSRSVYKNSLDINTNKHIQDIYNNYLLLEELYKDTKFAPNKCELIKGVERGEVYIGKISRVKDRIKLEYISGITLEKYLDMLNKNEEYEKMEQLIKEYKDIVLKIAADNKFSVTNRFNEIFGKRKFAKDYTASSVCNYDIIFSNIVLDKDELENGKWHVLDYEWVFDFPVPAIFTVYRALYYYDSYRTESGFHRYLEDKGTNIYKLCDISEEEESIFESMEHSFQVYIINGMASLEVMHEIMPASAIRFDKLMDRAVYLRNLNMPMVFYSSGEPFTSDKHINVLAKVTDGNKVSLDIKMSVGMKNLRIDPTEYPCIVKLEKAEQRLYGGNVIEVNKFMVNGMPISKSTVMFDTDDSQILIEDIVEGTDILHIEYTVTMLESEFYTEFKDYISERLSKDNKNDTVLDKIQYKLKIKKREIIPDGFYLIGEGSGTNK